MAKPASECPSCAAGQRLSTLTFALFAALLAGAALDPAETGLRQAALGLCAALSGIAVFRHGIARALARDLQRKRMKAAR